MAPKKSSSTKTKNNVTEETRFEDDKDKNFRKLSIIAYFLVLVVLGVPIWWYTTRVYRAALPLNDIAQLQINPQEFRNFGVPLSLDYDVLISFIHPDPGNLNIQVDVHQIQNYLQTYLDKLSETANFTVKSQWLYLTDLGVAPTKHSDHFILYEHQLPHVITPLETKLWSHVSSRTSVNLVVYFPHCSSPLYIYKSKNERSTTNAFVSPRWGGIYILNPDKESCEVHKFSVNPKSTASTFQRILLELFEIRNPSNDALKEFELNKIGEMLESSKRTLKSLAQLLSEINSIVISENVADQITLALDNVKKTEEYLSKDDHKIALKYAREAFRHSEDAFAHPSLLALLYFPDDQKYAIYIPLFLPVMIPVIISLIHLRRTRNEKDTIEVD